MDLLLQGVLMAALTITDTFHSCHERHPMELSQVHWNRSEQEIQNIVSTLRWSRVNLFFENSTDFPGSLVRHFHGSNILTAIFNNTKYVDTGTCFTYSEGGFLVMGSRDFVRHVFSQVPPCAEQTNQSSAVLYTSEWLTVLPEGDLEDMLPVFSKFENVAVIVRTKTGRLALWTLLQGPDGSQWSHVTSLPPPITRPLTHQRVLPNPSRGLGGRMLRVVVKQYTHFVMESGLGDPDRYEGVSIDILKELSTRLNFTYTYAPAPDDSFGRQLDNGQWDGPIGMLTRKEADMAVSALSVTQDRIFVAEPVIIVYDNTGILYRSPGVQESHRDLYVRPFKVTVYAVIAGCLVGVLLLLMMMEKVERGVLIGGQPTPETTSQWILRNVEIVVAGLLNKACTLQSTSRAGRVLVMTWLMMCVVLTSLYSSHLTSSLTVVSRSLPFNTLSELLSQDQYTWGYNNLTNVDMMLKSSAVTQLQQYRQGALKFSRTDPSVLSGNYSDITSKVARGNYAFLYSGSSIFDQLAAKFCGVVQLTDFKLTNPLAWYLQKDSPYSTLISAEIGRMVDSGLVDHWRRKWTPSKRRCDPDDEQHGGTGVGLTHTLTAFCLAATGLGMAALTLGLERGGDRIKLAREAVVCSNGERDRRSPKDSENGERDERSLNDSGTKGERDEKGNMDYEERGE